MKVRVGFGYDAHRFGPGKKLVLGGVAIPHHQGCIAHSDGDVLIHALMDALLGAAGLRDIGTYFPDSSDEFKGIDSRILLRKTCELVFDRGFRIGNADLSILAEKPKLAPFIPAMKKVLAEILKVGDEDIAIKAGTNEKMGFVGREEGIAAYAVILLEKD